MKNIVDYLGSLKHSVAVILLITFACIAGTLIPQGSEVTQYLKAHPSATKWMEILVAAGFTHVFSSLWFIILLSLLSVSLVICTIRRYKVARQLSGWLQIKAIGSMLTHISFLFILAGAVIRGMYGEKGHIAFREGETMDSYVFDGGSCRLPFSVNLKKFEIQTYESNTNQARSAVISSERLIVSIPESNFVKALPVDLDVEQTAIPAGDPANNRGAITVRIRRKVLDFVVDTRTREITSRSENPMNPAILVDVIENTGTNSHWLFARYPDFNMGGKAHQAQTGSKLNMRYEAEIVAPRPPRIKSYKSTLNIIEGQSVVKEVTIEVNSPFSYKGYTFYQSGYNPEDPSWTSLQVVKDPGVLIVYTGFLMMIIGMAGVFCINTEERQQG